MDWCYGYDGFKWNNDKYIQFMRSIKVGESVSVVVDRVKGTVGFGIDGKFEIAYETLAIKTGQLHFACCTGEKENVFEIEK